MYYMYSKMVTLKKYNPSQKKTSPYILRTCYSHINPLLRHNFLHYTCFLHHYIHYFTLCTVKSFCALNLYCDIIMYLHWLAITFKLPAPSCKSPLWLQNSSNPSWTPQHLWRCPVVYVFLWIVLVFWYDCMPYYYCSAATVYCAIFPFTVTTPCVLSVCYDITLCLRKDTRINVRTKIIINFSCLELNAEGGHGRVVPLGYFLGPWQVTHISLPGSMHRVIKEVCFFFFI